MRRLSLFDVRKYDRANIITIIRGNGRTEKKWYKIGSSEMNIYKYAQLITGENANCMFSANAASATD